MSIYQPITHGMTPVPSIFPAQFAVSVAANKAAQAVYRAAMKAGRACDDGTVQAEMDAAYNDIMARLCWCCGMLDSWHSRLCPTDTD